jgi:beta-glucanase (GH16 family)
MFKLVNSAKLVLLTAATMLFGCATAQNQTPSDPLPALPPGQKWQLAWADEFNGKELDPAKWEILGDWKRRDGFWTKSESYLNGNGSLILRTRQDGEKFVCGAVRTKDRFEHRYGYWITRCKLPTQPGHWPAFWIMSDGVFKESDSGRDGTEIDVAEFPKRDGTYEINLHWDGYGHAHRSVGKKITEPAITNGFHTYALQWTPTNYTFYMDGKEVWQTTAGGISQAPEYLKLSEEIGDWGGDIRAAKLPDYFEVDYVRVYDAVAK